MSYFFVHINDITAIKLVQFSFSKTHRYINFTSCLPSIYDDTTLKFWMFIEFDCLSDVPTLYISKKSFHLHYSLYWLTILFVLVFHSPAISDLFVKKLPENMYINWKCISICNRSCICRLVLLLLRMLWSAVYLIPNHCVKFFFPSNYLQFN